MGFFLVALLCSSSFGLSVTSAHNLVVPFHFPFTTASSLTAPDHLLLAIYHSTPMLYSNSGLPLQPITSYPQIPHPQRKTHQPLPPSHSATHPRILSFSIGTFNSLPCSPPPRRKPLLRLTRRIFRWTRRTRRAETGGARRTREAG